MITIKDLLTTVEFSKTKENGIIAVGVYNDISISLQQLTAPRTVGKSLIDDEDIIEELPAVRLKFYNTESVNVVIDALIKIKENINHPYGILPLVC